MEEAYEHIHMMMMKKTQQQQQQEGENSEESSTSTSSGSGSGSVSVSVSSSMEEDASSSSSSPNHSNGGPLFHLKDLMNQLPMRRGLSKHYKGKSQSFTSLAHVKSLEDLAKKVSPYGNGPRSRRGGGAPPRMIKSCKSYAVFADATHPTITSYK